MDIFTLPSYREVLDILDTYTNLEKSRSGSDDFEGGSERMQRLLKRLDSPHLGIPVVHIAGTKGKGSVSHLISAALAANGIKTGLYTSPHVDTVRERIMINNRPLGEQRFVEAMSIALREADAMRADGDAPSYFEIMTAAAFVSFRLSRVEAMVLETGLGGRLDATNVPDLQLVASGITTISMDHEEILGHSLAEIAAEKAAIIRNGVPVVSLPQEKSAMRVISERARERGSRLFVVGKDVKVELRKAEPSGRRDNGQRLDFETWRNVYPDIPLGLLGRHQALNAGMALGLADLFMEYMDREPLDSLVLKRAWRSISLPGRLEVVSDRPWKIIDGAHNPASAWAAAETILESFDSANRMLVFGVAADKDWRTMLRILAPLFERAVFTPFNSPRAVDPADLAAFAEKEFPGLKISVAIDPAHALGMAEEFTGDDGLILSTGSLYLAGEMRALLRKEPLRA